MEELKKRLLSLLWRIGWMSASMVVVFLTDNLDLIDGTFKLGPMVAVIAGLVLAEVSKAVRNKIVEK